MLRGKYKRIKAAFSFLLAAIMTAACADISVYAAGDAVTVGLTAYSGFSTIQISDKALNVSSSYGAAPSDTFVSNSGFTIVSNASSFDIKSGETMVASYDASSMPYIQGTDGTTTIGGAKYRGYLRPVKASNGSNLTNIVSESQYLYGVIPSEMPASWHIEALKAQAVAARTYMMYQKGKHSDLGYDVCDTIHCQVYLGTQKEHANSNAAADATVGKVAYYDGKPIDSVFFSSSGGFTEDSENVWVGSVPYLRSVKEVAENEYREWKRAYTLDQLANAYSLGSGQSLTAEYLPTGRLLSLTIKGSAGSKTIEKDNIRSISRTIDESLPSTMFTINGYGYGGTVEPTQTSAHSVYSIGASGGAGSVSGNAYAVGESGLATGIDTSGMSVIGAEGKVSTVTAAQTTAAQPTQTSAQTDTVTITSQTLVFAGKGYGHGVGMSQSGAKGMAEAGYTYDDILKFYYTGIEVR